MDDLERLFRLMVQTIEAKFPQYLARPFEVAELYQTIIPYRHYRRELGFETNQDYELALTHLLAGEREYLVVEDRLRDTVVKELQARNPDPGAFREFGDAHVSLNPEAVRALGASLPPVRTSSPATSPSPVAATEPRAKVTPPLVNFGASAPSPRSPGTMSRSPVSSAVSAAPTGDNSNRASTPSAASSRAVAGVVAAPGESCRFCAGVLPGDRRITFCPHCGQNLTIVNCPACGTELDVGWKFCTTCGRSVHSRA